LTIRTRPEYEALHTARQRQETPEFKERYKTRAGVEGTISQGVRTFQLRRTRYIGLAKTRLQHIATAAAINLTRAVSWMMDLPKAHTRVSHFRALASPARCEKKATVSWKSRLLGLSPLVGARWGRRGLPLARSRVAGVG
jgi:transposase